MKIIWVEDSTVLEYTLTKYCRKYNFEYEHQFSETEFCSKIEHVDKNTIILLDILFNKDGERDKEGRGIIVLKYLNEHHMDYVPVVILTVLAAEEVKEKIKKYRNVFAFIRKPVFYAELEEALNKAKKHLTK